MKRYDVIYNQIHFWVTAQSQADANQRVRDFLQAEQIVKIAEESQNDEDEDSLSGGVLYASLVY